MCEKLNDVGLQSYHQNLGRRERSKMKSYIAAKLGISYFAVDNKFAGRSKWSIAELKFVEPIIENEEWRQ